MKTKKDNDWTKYIAARFEKGGKLPGLGIRLCYRYSRSSYLRYHFPPIL